MKKKTTVMIVTKTKKEAEVDQRHLIDHITVVVVEDDVEKEEKQSIRTGVLISASKQTIVVRKQQQRFRSINQIRIQAVSKRSYY